MKYYSIFLIAISYMVAPKFCVYCEHFIPNKDGINDFGKCKLFTKEVRDNYFVTGEKKEQETSYQYCSTARKFDHMCGERAKKYVPSYMNEDL